MNHIIFVDLEIFKELHSKGSEEISFYQSILNSAVVAALIAGLFSMVTYYFLKKDKRGDFLRDKRLEIYPKIYDLIQTEAISPYIGFFNNLIIQVNKLEIDSNVIINFEDMLSVFFPNDENLGLKNVMKFNNYYYSSNSFFISNSVDKIVKSMGQLRHELYNILKDEIKSGKYKKYNKNEYIDLKNKVNIIVASLSKAKDALKNEMYKEVNLNLFPQ